MNNMRNDPDVAAQRLDESTRMLLQGLLDAGPPGHAVAAASPELRRRLLERVAHSVRAASVFHTVRGPADWQVHSDWRERILYRRDGAQPLRAGEPLRVRLIELPPGARCELANLESGMRCEWLVMQGDATIGGSALSAHDYHVSTAGTQPIELGSAGGARLYLREAPAAPGLGGQSVQHTVRAAVAAWHDHAPGIQRRVLWQHGGEAALLYRVQPGAAVPGHVHGHDEECLLIDGEVFIDDILLRVGEYQLAPAGTGHEGVSSDTGGLIYAHGDIELDLKAPPRGGRTAAAPRGG
jgi:quercetin dioxygenase-like cupin family protein